MGIDAGMQTDHDVQSRWTALLLSQEGKLDIMLLTAAMICPIAAIMAHYSGHKVFLFTLSSGMMRLTLGLLSALSVLGLSFIFQHPYRPSLLLGSSLLACSLIAAVLIPLSMIQILATMLKQFGRFPSKAWRSRRSR